MVCEREPNKATKGRLPEMSASLHRERLNAGACNLPESGRKATSLQRNILQPNLSMGLQRLAMLHRSFASIATLRGGQSTVGGPKWIKTSLGKMDHIGPFWSRKYQNPVRNKVILTKMVVLTILDHLGPVHFPTVPRPFPKLSFSIVGC